VHHPLALESGLSAHEADAFRASERAALAMAALTIVTSAATARLLAADYGVAANCIVVALPGVDAVSPTAVRSEGAPRLLAVGSVTPRKGYDLLIAALAPLSGLSWKLTIAGPCDRDPEAAQRLRADIVRFELTDRITLVGPVAPERLAELYRAADLFVLASRFEGYGMAFAEAVACGLPVIGTTADAIPEATAGAGILVPPDDVAALSEALRTLISDPLARARAAAASRAAATRLPTWRAGAEVISQALESLR
jgi:glycosyltransferase involved in cell wall biosynthesis